MQYIVMSVEEANKILGKNGKVLVAIQDLEKNEECIDFVKKNTSECEQIIREGKTIAKVCDDYFINQLRIFTEIQIDVINYKPRGKLSTILLKNR